MNPCGYSKVEAVGLSRSQAASLAQKVAESVGDTSDIDQLVSRLGGIVRHQVMDRHQDASLVVHGPEDFEIAPTPDLDIHRRYFSLAHDLAHYVIHSRMGNLRVHAPRYGDERVEWEANWFAAELIMPETEFRKISGRGDTEIASYFFTLESYVAVRRETLGIPS